MLSIGTDARRLVIRLSGRFEVQVMNLARDVANREGATVVSADHVKVATESLAGDNTALLRILGECESANHVRRAG